MGFSISKEGEENAKLEILPRTWQWVSPEPLVEMSPDLQEMGLLLLPDLSLSLDVTLHMEP